MHIGKAAPPFFISYAFNNLLPMRAGDFYRIVGFRRELGVGGAVITASLLMERLLDLLVLALFFGIGLPLARGVDLNPGLVWAVVGAVFLGLTSLGLLVGFTRHFVALMNHPAIHRLVGRFRVMALLRRGVQSVMEALVLFLRREHRLQLVASSVGIWFLEGAFFAGCVYAVQGSLMGYAPWFVMALATLSTLIPSTPGYVGTFHYFVILGFSAFGLVGDSAASLAILVHLLLWVPVTATGLVFFSLNRQRVSMAPVEGPSPEGCGAAGEAHREGLG
jgi:hypothetical protein